MRETLFVQLGCWGVDYCEGPGGDLFIRGNLPCAPPLAETHVVFNLYQRFAQNQWHQWQLRIPIISLPTLRTQLCNFQPRRQSPNSQTHYLGGEGGGLLMRRVLLMRGVLLIRGAAAYENPENETLLISDERIATYLPIGFLLGGVGARGFIIRGYG